MKKELKIYRTYIKVCLYLMGMFYVCSVIEKPTQVYAVEIKKGSQSENGNSEDPSQLQKEETGTSERSLTGLPSKTPAGISIPSQKLSEVNDKQANPENSPTPYQLVAFVTEDGQPIEKGLLWRIFSDDGTEGPISSPLVTDRSGSPLVQLKPGNYIINVTFGRAHLTRPITVSARSSTEPVVEKFVLNAGGLRVNALLSGKLAPAGSVAYSIYTDRDQSDERKLILAGAKTGIVMRLNAGIYYIESIYGDANASVRSDVTVEAGKLTEVTISHSFAKISFKLVTISGGDALPNTRWSIQTADGAVVKESIGALPSHTLAPGTYTVIARNQDKAFKKEFKVQDGKNDEIEIILK